MSTTKISRGIEALIEEAMARGDFENLRGKGRPLNLDAYFDTPEDLRVGFALLKSAGFLPDELELRAEINMLEEKRRVAADGSERQALSIAIQDRILRLNLLLERFHRRRQRS